ncbi:MAG TPA: ADP-ribosyl-[dinitrogen reductase] hydrolase [Geobacteraceae bacterium]|nr:ADP-ribosyl-[dinitrogen reductase] hydrolase [Geobacteraceae bacterium]
MTADRTHNLDDVRSRARAAFIGLAVGDALGAPVEFMTAAEIVAEYGLLKEIVGGGWLRLKPGQVTDDTAMALCIARAVVKSGRWSLTAIADNFAAWLKSRPVDVGDTCRRGIRNYMLKGTLETPYNQWDAGNGALMRMLPAALFTLGDDRLMADCVVAQARITHNHPLSDGACVIMGKLLHLALLGASKNRLRSELELLFAGFEKFRFHAYKGLSTGYVVDTIQTVLYNFFRGQNFEECLVDTVNRGGDADTAGAIVGALAGAYYDLEGIPKRWLKRMDRSVIAEVDRLAVQLIDLSPLSTGV